MNQTTKTKIYCNIFDLTQLNYYLHPFGIGLYHTSITINSIEYSFGAHDGNFTGVSEYPHLSVPVEGHIYRETVLLGETTLTRQEQRQIIDILKKQYTGKSYDIFSRNCNHFTNELAFQLLDKPLPQYLNRVANCLYFFRCLIPEKYIKGEAVPQQPVQDQSQQNQGTSLLHSTINSLKKFMNKENKYSTINSINDHNNEV